MYDSNSFFETKEGALNCLRVQGFTRLPEETGKYAMIDMEYWKRGYVTAGIREQMHPHGWVVFYRS